MRLVKEFVAKAPNAPATAGRVRPGAFAHVTITTLSFLLVDNRIIELIGLAGLATCFYLMLQMRAVRRSVRRLSAAIFSLMFSFAVRRLEGASPHSEKNPGDSNAVWQ